MFTFVVMELKIKNGRKKQIETIATSLFQQKGYAATSMRDLAADLGIEAASIYSHVKSKEEILKRICFRMADEFFETINSLVKPESGVPVQLKQAIMAHIMVVTKDPAASAVFFNEWRHLGQPALDEFLQMRSDYEARFKYILKTGIAKSVFKNVDINLTMLTLLSSINFMPNWYKKDGKYNADEIAEQIAQLFINGIKK